MASVFKTGRHPFILFIYFLGAVCFSISIKNPLFLGVSTALAVVLAAVQKNRRAFRMIFVCAPLFLFFGGLNFFVSHWGSTVLFTIFGLPHTLEALCYGLNTALLFLCMTLWFMNFGTVMTSGRFTFLFARFFPALSLMLTMILRFFPLLARRAEDIQDARNGAGMSRNKQTGTIKTAIQEGMAVFEAVAASTLEDGIFTTHSLLARGYGSAKRTSFLEYRFSLCDFFLAAFFIFCAAAVIVGCAHGGGAMTFYPEISVRIADATNWDALCFCGYTGELLFLILFCRN